MKSTILLIVSFWKEYKKHKTGLMGLILLSLLIAASIFAFVFIPFETYKQWYNPTYWNKYPKSVPPSWINYFLTSKLPEHIILNSPRLSLIEAEHNTFKIINH
ncbi:MAG: hypothetical protein QW265_05145, partial [Candidatus Bathyarchaeia archaeon]